MNAYVGPNLLHVHAVTHQRAVEVAAEKDRLLFQAGAARLPFGIHRLPIPHVKPVLQTAIAGISTFVVRWQREVPTHRLPAGETQAQLVS
jgi:hypothetical protein